MNQGKTKFFSKTTKFLLSTLLNTQKIWSNLVWKIKLYFLHIFTILKIHDSLVDLKNCIRYKKLITFKPYVQGIQFFRTVQQLLEKESFQILEYDIKNWRS